MSLYYYYYYLHFMNRKDFTVALTGMKLGVETRQSSDLQCWDYQCALLNLTYILNYFNF